MAVVATNLFPNPKVATLTGFASYSSSGSASTYSTLTRASSTSTVAGVTAPYGARATALASMTYLDVRAMTGVPSTGPSTVPAVPGQVYTASVYTRTSNVALTSVLYVQFFNAAGAVLATQSTTLPASSTGYQRVSVTTAAAPEGTVAIGMILRASGAVVSGNVVDGALWMITSGSGLAAWFDGDSPWSAIDSYVWTGDEDASSSRHSTVAAPSVSVFDDDTLGPRVAVVFTDLAATAQTITVYRSAEGRTMPVRGGVDLYAVGGAPVLDQEVPFGIPVAYFAEQFDSTGASLGNTPSVSVTIDTADAWVSQPLNPALALQVRVRVPSTATLGWESPGDTLWTQGGSVGRVINGQRSGLKSVSLLLRLLQPSDAATFDSMFGTYDTTYPAVLCIRTPPNVPLPPVLFFGCRTPKRLTSGANKLVQYQLDGDEVAPPAPGLVIPALSRDDIDTAYPTRAARAAAYTSRLERDTDYTLTGLAG